MCKIEDKTFAGTVFAKELYMQIFLKNCTRKSGVLIEIEISETKGRHPKEKTGFFGNFSQMSDPPLPPFWEPVFPKKNIRLAFLALRSIFGLHKNVHFLVNFTFGNR